MLPSGLLICFSFVAGFLLNYTWAACVRSVNSRRPLAAANYSVMLYLCSIVSTLLLIEWCVPAIIAYVIGDWLGIFTIVWRGRNYK